MSPKLLRFLMYSLASVALVFCTTPILQSQSSAPSKPLSDEQLEQRFAGAPNRWQLTAVDPQSQRDPVVPSIRAARNAFMRPWLQELRDLEVGGERAGDTFDGFPSLVEITADTKHVWVIATFDHYSVHSIDPDFKLLYTEMSFKISEVIWKPRNLLLPSDMSFDVDVVGGSIKHPQRGHISWKVVPRRFFVQPKHAYLMEILPPDDVNAQLYTISKKWDVSSGVVVPGQNSPSSGSKLAGMTTQDAIAYLQSILPPVE